MEKMVRGFMVVALIGSMYGCAAAIVGGAAGAGTAAWLSNKMTQTFNASYDQTVTASEKALSTFPLPIKSEKKDPNVTQIRSETTNAEEVWIDIRRVTDTATQVEVRVGVTNPDKAMAQQIMNAIRTALTVPAVTK
jgi:hypothetical protein